MAELSLRRSKKVTQVPLVSSASIAATSDRSQNTAKNADKDDDDATNKDDNHVHVPETKVISTNYNKLSVSMAQKARSSISAHTRKEVEKISKKKAKKSKKGKKVDVQELKKEVDISEHQMTLEELERHCSTNFEVGLTAAEHQIRLLRDGLNVLTPPKTRSAVVKLMIQLFGGFAALLWCGALLCFIAYTVKLYVDKENDKDTLYLGVVLVLVVVISALFSFFQDAKGAKIMESFKKMIPPTAVVIRDGQARDVLAEELVVGDVIQLKGGDGLPADIRIIENFGLKVDNSALTGEPEALMRSVDSTSDNPLETKNLAFYSTNCVEGQGKGVVIYIGDNTVMGRIASLVTNVVSDDTPIKKEISIFIRMISILAVLLGIILAIAHGLLYKDAVDALVFLIGIIVANVPEGLLPTVTVCLTITAKKMAKKFCLVKNLEAVETLGSVSTICSDKTGTLTQNRMTVSHMWFDNQITDADITPEQENSKKHLANLSYQRLMRCVTLCNRAAFKPDQDHLPILQRETIADASESALFKYSEVVYGGAAEYRVNNTKVCEIPFNSTNKYQLSIHVKQKPISHGTPGELLLCMKGAPEQIIERCSTIFAQGYDQTLTEHWREEFSIAYNALGGMGERVLGFADLNLPMGKYNKDYNFETDPKPNFPTEGLRFLGLVTLIDPPRPSVPDAVAKCREAGVRVIMVTGDHPITAEAIARKVGIITEGSKTIPEIAEEEGVEIIDVDPSRANACVVHGQDLKDLDDNQLDILLATHPEIVFARTSPQQKLIIVEACQRGGAIVAVTGDGVNDSPALKKADIGIAMGIAGTDVAKQAADMILLDDNFASIVTGIEEGRIIFDNIKKTIAYVLTSNIPEMIPFIIGIFLGLPLPLGTITILFIDLGTDIIPCIAMAYEVGEAEVMRRPPRNPKIHRLVTQSMFYVAYGWTGFIESAAGFYAWGVLMAMNGWAPNDLIYSDKKWKDKANNYMEDSYGQHWTYDARQDLKFAGQSIFFISIVVCQIFNIIQSKTRIVSVFHHGCTNKIIIFAILSELILTVVLVYVPYINETLKFREVRGEWWLLSLPFGIIILGGQELRKYLVRRYKTGFVAEELYF